MKDVIVTIKNDKLITYQNRCKYIGDNIYLDSNFKDKIIFFENSLKIIRENEGIKTEVFLSDKPYLHINFNNQILDINIEIIEIVFNDEYVNIKYNTGELIEIRIDFIKE